MRVFLLLFLWVAAFGQSIPFEQDFKDITGARWLDRAVQVRAESNFNPNARSFDHGEGLGQATNIWPQYVKNGWVPPDSTPFQVRPAIMGAHRYMLWQEKFLGGWIIGCGGYNAGAGNIKKALFIAKTLGLEGGDAWLQALPKVTKSNAAITQRYIGHIRTFRAEYRARFGE